MRRLYLQIYVSIIAILGLFALCTSLAWLAFHPSHEYQQRMEGMGELISGLVPAADAKAEQTQAALDRLARQLSVHLTLRGGDGQRIASVGEIIPAPASEPQRAGWRRMRGGAAVVVPLSGGRWLYARDPEHPEHGLGWLAALGLLALVTTVGAYPVVRRLTRRLERLRTHVEQLGAGDLAARVSVEGRDEVADLARSFNRAAQRIERVVHEQRNMLASASHELRSPLARIQMAMELLAGDERPELRARVSQDIRDLDELIGELLLASRLDVIEKLDQREDIDLLALVAEEAERGHASASGETVHIQGDPRMLRRLVRNLLENARRYGAGTPIETTVSDCEGGARLRVLDRGPGVPEPERERIFEPFYRPAGLRESVDGGVGLGLALVAQIARHHGGEARCLPREGGGTCFEVLLRGTS